MIDPWELWSFLKGALEIGEQEEGYRVVGVRIQTISKGNYDTTN
jgi:hypothetical protein